MYYVHTAQHRKCARSISKEKQLFQIIKPITIFLPHLQNIFVLQQIKNHKNNKTMAQRDIKYLIHIIFLVTNPINYKDKHDTKSG